MSVSTPTALTVGEIAKQLSVPLHRVLYVVRSRDIRPTARAGNARVFSESDLQYIGSEIRRIDREKGELL